VQILTAVNASKSRKKLASTMANPCLERVIKTWR